VSESIGVTLHSPSKAACITVSFHILTVQHFTADLSLAVV
jgi:hypothetical protein